MDYRSLCGADERKENLREAEVLIVQRLAEYGGESRMSS